MGIPKGAKYGGRVKGTPNKKTTEQLGRAETILRILESDFLENDLMKLTAGQRITLYTDMLEYVAPKLSRQEVTGEGGGPLEKRYEITLKI